MAKKQTVQVILTEDIPKLGKKGNIIKVKLGYSRNYLIPLKCGKIATPNLIRQFDLQKKDSKAKEEQFLQKCIIAKEILEGIEKFIIKKKISESGTFFGKITKKQILDLINSKVNVGIELNKNQLQLPKMEKLGNFDIEFLLAIDIVAKVNIEILPE
uniref:50S ribosomal protein L9 n=1 Tax=Scytothamnus australis TaxID=66621 RepID=UPI002E75EEE2|nr:50S ribosomal protein L9 [Scytothamnus australis]WAM64807.1 50S ribosomal protein L9 [Scytothamnus australis]